MTTESPLFAFNRAESVLVSSSLETALHIGLQA